LSLTYQNICSSKTFYPGNEGASASRLSVQNNLSNINADEDDVDVEGDDVDFSIVPDVKSTIIFHFFFFEWKES